VLPRSQPWLPALIASICTVLVVIDWFLSAPGIAEQIAQFNRALGIVVMWSAAMLARNTLLVRLRLRQDEWLRTARTRIADAVAGEQSLTRSPSACSKCS
jgi:K+-sensing histidine kinase KdpD